MPRKQTFNNSPAGKMCGAIILVVYAIILAIMVIMRVVSK